MKKCGKFLKKCVWLEKNLLQIIDDGSFVESDVLVTPEFKLCSTPSHNKIYYTVHKNIPLKLFKRNKRIKTNVNIKKRKHKRALEYQWKRLTILYFLGIPPKSYCKSGDLVKISDAKRFHQSGDINSLGIAPRIYYSSEQGTELDIEYMCRSSMDIHIKQIVAYVQEQYDTIATDNWKSRKTLKNSTPKMKHSVDGFVKVLKEKYMIDLYPDWQSWFFSEHAKTAFHELVIPLLNKYNIPLSKIPASRLML